ncbi:MAG: hypothetical protein Q8904_00010 [Bacteroidota bacterium]|nr:hypothetical protein [Bacteroidota bacterium]
MEQYNYFTLIVIWGILMLVVFFHWEGDMTLRFSTLIMVNSLHGHLYSDKKLKKINALVSLLLIIAVFILGFGCKYFTY